MVDNGEKVSVVTAMFNAERLIGQTIESVLAQSYTNWEMLVVDDASLDTSREVVARYAATDERVRLIQMGTNAGPAAARNAAIEAASGRFIAFLDSDDLWYPRKLEKQISFMAQNGHTLTYTQYEHITEDGRTTGTISAPPPAVSYDDLLQRGHIGCLTAVYDQEKLGKVYMPNIRRRQDYGLWLRILRQERWAYGVPEVLASYRRRRRSLSSSKLILPWYHWRLYSRQEKLGLWASLVTTTRYTLNVLDQGRSAGSIATRPGR